MRQNDFNQYISNCEFQELFIELGWNNPNGQSTLPRITVDEKDYDINVVAQRNGFQVLTCEVKEIPKASLCKKIDTKLRRQAEDYICIFYTNGSTHQQWVVPLKKIEKRDIVTVEYSTVDQASFLYSKVEALTFGLDQKTTIMDVKEAVQRVFNVNSEKVTKSFYKQFQKEHKSFTKYIEGIEVERDKDWYASVMLNRLMFCYFIQKKGFLDNNTNYLQDKLKWVKEEKGKNQFFGTFYKEFLRRMFKEGLDYPRHDTDEFLATFGRIPYLNGGMFDEHQLEKENTCIDISDKAFESLFDFFDQWNWHLDTRLTASGKDINPDVLGYIFEQYINDRAQKGAYYTKEDITEYIGKNCIIPFLVDKTAEHSQSAFGKGGYAWNMVQASKDRYIYDVVKKGYTTDWKQRIPDYIAQGIDTTAGNLLERRSRWNEKTSEEFALPTEIWRETIERLQRCDSLLAKINGGEILQINDFITYNLDIRLFAEDLIKNAQDHLLVKHFYHALQHVTILDPTCGSGAFLFAALNILEPLYEACLDRMEEWHDSNDKLFVDELKEIYEDAKFKSNRQYFIFKSIILRNLYGVDIMVEATEIAKLRLFLKMVAVVDVDRRKDNLGLDPLPDIDFNIKCGNTLVGYATEDELNRSLLSGGMFAAEEFREKIEQMMQVVSTAYSCFRSEQLKTYDTNASLKATKDKLKKRLGELNELLNGHMHKSIASRMKYDAWKSSHQPFHWLAEFYQIIKGNGGFDVIIGNPPYVVYTKKDRVTKKSIADVYSLSNYVTIECNNLYGFVMERSHNIANLDKRIGMIVPLSFTAAKNMLSLRRLYTNAKKLYVSSYEIRPAKLFDGGKDAEQRLNIIISHKSCYPSVKSTEVIRWHSENRELLFKNLSYTSSHQEERILRFSKEIENSILAKYNSNKPISNYYVNRSYNLVHYRSAGLRYWIIFLNNGFGTESQSNRHKCIDSVEHAKHIMAVLNSNLYWWYYATNYDMFNQTDSNVSEFRYSYIRNPMLELLAEKLEKDMDSNKQFSVITKHDGDINESFAYQKKISKPIIDEIDKVLAKHYGFNEEELDFILNYNIKFRMGDELDNE